jgi:outer membrane beta-barrel protein
VLLALSHGALAQSLPGSELPEVSGSSASAGGNVGGDIEAEDIYDKDDSKPQAKTPARNRETKEPLEAPQNLSDLAKLAPFSDIAVIQRRFLPKTDRFEASASGFTNLNNPFYSAYGVGLEFAYYLQEKYAIGVLGQFAATGSRQVTDDLEKKRSISTANLVTARGFFGANFKWNPIYGKITLLNKTIVPFDLNFSLGLGMTQTTVHRNEPTLHIGTSQVFAYSKSMAFRWDLSLNTYQASVTEDDGRINKLTQNDLYLGVGVSFYFPEATYR